jgi:hypothetical protein
MGFGGVSDGKTLSKSKAIAVVIVDCARNRTDAVSRVISESATSTIVDHISRSVVRKVCVRDFILRSKCRCGDASTTACGSRVRGKLGSIPPRRLFSVLSHKDTSNIRSNRFGNGFQPLSIFPCSNRCSLAVGETAVTFEDGVSGAADFVEIAQGACSP